VRAAARNRELFHSTRLADAEDAERYVGKEWNEQRVFDRYDWLFSYDATAPVEPVQA
jgi:salicylate hydroxylase